MIGRSFFAKKSPDAVGAPIVPKVLLRQTSYALLDL